MDQQRCGIDVIPSGEIKRIPKQEYPHSSRTRVGFPGDTAKCLERAA
jgi:hypothetical protein